ncbi:MAG: DUF1460 domain-containing protein [Legionellaceae bacterium]|nr:DUF1460 domain-containing protein [Legionellaceae bacterium]
MPSKHIYYTLALTSYLVLACEPAFSDAEADQTIRQLYHTLDAKPTPMATRLDAISQRFINQPYEGNALGEGPGAPYDQAPIYRVDAFDCETYVDTVVALALAPDLNHFTQCIKNIRYADGDVTFTKRNHFASLDWNQNNQHAGILKDITTTLTNQKGEPAARYAKALINKPEWYKQLDQERIRLPHALPEEQSKQLNALRREGKHLKAQRVNTPYIPLTALFDTQGKPNLALFDQIPDGAIIEIIRPNWNLATRIGTRLNVSHMGFVFRKEDDLRFRHASLLKKKVSDMSLISYLERARTSPTIRGINIQIIVPQSPEAKNCG